jgi:uracil-DNA glycosylase
VWHTLAGLAVAPLIWNTYPLHPHRPGQPRSNRPPRRPEIALGEDFVRHIVALYAPRRIIAVGGVAAGALARLSLAGERIRHPAQGGKAAFVAGLTRLLSPDTAS